MANINNGPWIVAGDFNEVLLPSEKFGGFTLHTRRADRFRDCLNYCNLLDLGFTGSKYTWTNKRGGGNTIVERLDSVVANFEWFHLFPEAAVVHLPRVQSDHCPLLLKLNPSIHIPNKPFRVENIWFSHPDFPNVVSTAWASSNNSLLPAVELFTKNASLWNKHVFGNIFAKKRRLLAHLGGIQKSPHYPTSSFLHSLEETLQQDYQWVLIMEQDFWKLNPESCG